jgi:threonine dehydrogenase-like Zn-dependent dehydrogenase
MDRVPEPKPAADELVLRVEAASICATDIRILHGAHRKFGPGTVRIPGHEVVGAVEDAGPEVHQFRPGDRVFIAPNMGCGQCVPCRRGKNNLCPDYQAFGITMDGGFAELMRVSAPAIQQGNVLPVSSDIDPALIALAEPLACVLHGQDAVKTGPGDVVVVVGAGPIGLMHALLARSRGAACVIVADREAARLEVANTFAGARTVDVTSTDLREAVYEQSGGAGADVIIVAAPSAEAQRDALHLGAPGARINFFAGLPKEDPTVRLDANLIHYKELVITGTTACSTNDCRKALSLITSRAIDLTPLISARYPLARAIEAFAAAENRSNLKVVLEMNGRERPVGGTPIATTAI